VSRGTRTTVRFLLASLALAPGHVLAQPLPPPAPAPASSTTPVPEGAAPVALAPKQRPSIHATAPPPTGFRGIFDVGLSIPVGSASGAPGDKLGERYSVQLPLIAEVGRIIEHSFYAGIYLGLALGGQGQSERVAGECSADDAVTCRSGSGMAGLAVQYSINPGARFSPWLGYGIGFELSQLEVEDPADERDERVTSTGITYARLSAGLDVREKVGFGPFVQVALGQFTSTETKLKGSGEFERRIEDRALHAWITLGARVVLNP